MASEEKVYSCLIAWVASPQRRQRSCGQELIVDERTSRISLLDCSCVGQLPFPSGGNIAAHNINWHKSQPAPKDAIRFIHANFPQVRNLGIYVCRNVKGTSVKSSHAEGRALDIGLRADSPAESLIGDQLFKAIIHSASKSGIDNVIWNRQIWSVAHPSIRPFVGNYPGGGPRNPHTDHIHVEWTRGGSQFERLVFWSFRSVLFVRELRSFHHTTEIKPNSLPRDRNLGSQRTYASLTHAVILVQKG